MAGDRDRLLARLRFHHLHLIRELARAGSLRGAAEAMHVTQPALSKGLKEVERTLGLLLFERTPRGLRPTHEGQVVTRGASLLLAELQHVRREAEAAGGRAAAVLRIGTVPYIAFTYLPAVLGDLLRQDPPILARLMDGQVRELLKALIGGELDALLTTYTADPEALRGAEPLMYEKVTDAEIVIIAPPKHPLALAARVQWSELAKMPWVLPAPPSLIRRTIDDAFLRAGVPPPEPGIESTNPMINVRFVASGLGFGAVPGPAAADAVRAGQVARVRIAPRVPSVPVALIYRSASSEHPRIIQLRKALKL